MTSEAVAQRALRANGLPVDAATPRRHWAIALLRNPWLWLILGARWPVYIASLALPVATLGFWGQRVAMSREPGSALWYVGGAVVAVLIWNAVIAWRAAAARRS